VHGTLVAEQIASLVRGEPLRVIPVTSTDGRERIEAGRDREEASDGLHVLPDPRPRPA
jgi:hypothetical protein